MLEPSVPIVGVVMMVTSEEPLMRPCLAELDARGLSYELKCAAAHRKPDLGQAWARDAADRGMRVIVAVAGRSPHLGRVAASHSPLPVVVAPLRAGESLTIEQVLPDPGSREELAERVHIAEDPTDAARLVLRLLGMPN